MENSGYSHVFAEAGSVKKRLIYSRKSNGFSLRYSNFSGLSFAGSEYGLPFLGGKSVVTGRHYHAFLFIAGRSKIPSVGSIIKWE